MRKLVLQNRFTNYNSETFKSYLSEIQMTKPLTPQEERDLIVDIRNSKKRDKILNTLILHNLRFVITVAKQYVSKDNLLVDLVNEGNLGLIEASRRFDETLGIRFFSYAVWWIRRNMTLYVTNNKSIRIPHNKNFTLLKIQAYADRFIQANGRPCNEDELLSAGFELCDVNDYFILDTFQTTTMDSPIESDGEGIDGVISDNLVASYYQTDHGVNEEDLKFKISVLLKTIKKEREREIIIKLYGLDGEESMTIQSVAASMDMTTERIRQIKESTLKKMYKNRSILFEY